MTFTNLKYIKDQSGNNISIKFTCNGQTEMSVAVGAVGNMHYDEIIKQVDAGTITIAAAD
mgnify:CR=1 FL=1|jgi:hypothetical protein|tara:strand:- start:113 stop:292 length:180 start_codon:yes stop_codon:yes gene_type:complete